LIFENCPLLYKVPKCCWAEKSNSFQFFEHHEIKYLQNNSMWEVRHFHCHSLFFCKFQSNSPHSWQWMWYLRDWDIQFLHLWDILSYGVWDKVHSFFGFLPLNKVFSSDLQFEYEIFLLNIEEFPISRKTITIGRVETRKNNVTNCVLEFLRPFQKVTHLLETQQQ
jgi:hypothetical protein